MKHYSNSSVISHAHYPTEATSIVSLFFVRGVGLLCGSLKMLKLQRLFQEPMFWVLETQTDGCRIMSKSVCVSYTYCFFFQPHTKLPLYRESDLWSISFHTQLSPILSSSIPGNMTLNRSIRPRYTEGHSGGGKQCLACSGWGLIHLAAKGVWWKSGCFVHAGIWLVRIVSIHQLVIHDLPYPKLTVK